MGHSFGELCSLPVVVEAVRERHDEPHVDRKIAMTAVTLAAGPEPKITSVITKREPAMAGRSSAIPATTSRLATLRLCSPRSCDAPTAP